MDAGRRYRRPEADGCSSFVPTMNVKTVTKIDRPANTYAY